MISYNKYDLALITARELMRNGQSQIKPNPTIYRDLTEEERHALDVFMTEVEKEIRRIAQDHPGFPADVG